MKLPLRKATLWKCVTNLLELVPTSLIMVIHTSSGRTRTTGRTTMTTRMAHSVLDLVEEDLVLEDREIQSAELNERFLSVQVSFSSIFLHDHDSV